VTTRRGDAFLEQTHLVSQVWLVTHCGWHTAEQRGNLRTCLSETEDVVDEQKHVLLLNVTEVLSHRQSRESNAKTRSRWLVHLAEHECGLVDNARLGHFVDQVVTLTGTLTDTGEHGNTVVVVGHAVDHFLDQNGLANTCTTEQTDLSTLHIRGQEVDRLDTGLEHLSLGLKLVECWWLTVDWPTLGNLERLAFLEVQWCTGHVEDVSLGDVTYWDRDRYAGVGDNRTANQTIGWLQCDRTHEGVSQVLSDLKGHREGLFAFTLRGQVNFHGQSVVDLRDRVCRELDVNDWTDHTGNAPLCWARSRIDRCFDCCGSH
jgi:peptide chain release factor 1